MGGFCGKTHGTGQLSLILRTKRETLVRNGKASYWKPYRSPEEALKAAGLL